MPLDPAPGVTVVPAPLPVKTIAEKETEYLAARAEYLADHPPVEGDPPIPAAPRAFVPKMPGIPEGGITP